MKAGQVFINCPFTADYDAHFRAIVFTVIRSGFEPRCARETDDGGENRFDKISRIVAECDFGIHDISMTDLDAASGLPRFNMPLELGLFLGAKRFGAKKHRSKKAMILDRDRHRFQTFISDISGQDIHAHHGETTTIIREVASWLRDEARNPSVPGGVAISREHDGFAEALPAICEARKLDPSELTFRDYAHMAAEWIAAEAEANAGSRRRARGGGG